MSLATLKKKTKSKYSKISSSVRYKPKRELVTENNETYYKENIFVSLILFFFGSQSIFDMLFFIIS